MPSHKHTRFTPTDPQTSGHAPVLKVKTHLKAGGCQMSTTRRWCRPPARRRAGQDAPQEAGSIIVYD